MDTIFRHLGPGEFPGSQEYNRLLDAVTGLLGASNVQYFVDSRGVHVRKTPSEADEKGNYSHGFHGGGTPLAVVTNTLTTIPIDFTISDPNGWLASEGFVVPYDGIYFASAAFWVIYGLHVDVEAYVVGKNITGGGAMLKSVQEITISTLAVPFAMLFHISGMVKLEAGDLFQYMFWHEAGGANTMEMSNSMGAHASLWLIEHM